MHKLKFLFLATMLSIGCAFAQSLPTATLTASDAAGFLGSSVAISGSTVAAGAPAATANGFDAQGIVYVFTKAATAPWPDMTESARLINPKGGPGEELGSGLR